MSGDWADEKAAETMKLMMNPGVTLDQAADFLAATFRLVEATGAGRGIDRIAAAIRTKEPAA